MTSMGAGGKGIVGYRIYAAKKDSVNNFNESNVAPKISNSDPIDKVIPLFEITNEGPDIEKTKGFEDLGYTYSGFEFFNYTNNTGRGQSIAVFGNGFGVDKSILYFINAYTGEKLHEILLNNNGGGAATPSIIVKEDANGHGQILDRIYVGDYEGNLYRIQFNTDDFRNEQNVTVTLLFNIPAKYTKTNQKAIGQSAISIKPLVVKNTIPDTDQTFYTIAFGSGLAGSQELDRGNNSLISHSIYNIVEHNSTNRNSTATVSELKHGVVLSKPILTEDSLSKGSISYAGNQPKDYLSKQNIDTLTITKTTNDIITSNGWYRRLTADNDKSGERIIASPKYDAVNKAILFSTWAIWENYSAVDACMPSEPYHKILSLDINNGGNTEKIGNLRNIAMITDIRGGITGDTITDSPEGNTNTNLKKIYKDYGINIKAELLTILGDANSSYLRNNRYIGRFCVDTIKGADLQCELVNHRKKLMKKRVSIQKII